MSAVTNVIRGIFPIVYTPFDREGRVVESDLQRLIDYMIAQGTHGLAAVGGASECHKMSLAERKWLAEATISAAAGRVPVLVGTSATCIADLWPPSPTRIPVGWCPELPNGEVPPVPIHLLPPSCRPFCSRRRSS